MNMFFFVHTLIIFIVANIFYAVVSVGLEKRILYLQFRRNLLMAFLYYGLQNYLGKSIFSLEFAGHICVGLSWAVIYPLQYYWTYRRNMTFFSYHHDVLLGFYLPFSLIVLQALVMAFSLPVQFVTVLFTFLDGLLLLLPISLLVYYSIYRQVVSEFALIAIYESNFREGVEFLKTYVSCKSWLVIGAVCLGLLGGLYLTNAAFAREIIVFWPQSNREVAYWILGIGVAGYFPLSLYKKVGVIALWQDVLQYQKKTRSYRENHAQRCEEISFSQATLPEKLPGTVILVIGESASRDYMQAYRPDFRFFNTPWMTSKKGDEGFFFLENAYASWVQTVVTVTKALTESSQYNQKEFNESVSILDVAKKAGYYTSWYSNQGTVDSADVGITLLADTADTAAWTSQSLTTVQYDHALLEFLPQIDPKRNNFVVFHVMGSHANYKNRYPADFMQWGDPHKDMPLEDYANSILYTDEFLRQVYEYGKEKLNLQVMVYCSDHGDSLQRGHSPDIFDANEFSAVRIPMFIDVSPAYQEVFPEQYHALQKNCQTCFTNDLLYDTLCGILGAQSRRYEARQDLSSPAYGFDANTLTVLLGRHKVREDPRLIS